MIITIKINYVPKLQYYNYYTETVQINIQTTSRLV